MTTLSITSDELKSRLDGNQHLMVFDIGERRRFEQQHIPGSAYAVCDEAAKKNIMPKLPKNIEIVLVSDDDEYTKNMAEMMLQIGLNAKYLQGGIGVWRWNLAKSSSERHISSIDLKKWMDRGTDDAHDDEFDDDLYLLDVREPDEFKEWSIDGSVNIPLSRLSSNQESINHIPKDKRIVTICSHGNRSTIAKYMLERYGYNVSKLEGGLKSWNTS
jgi:rhodanese-related sulfurtransferase